MNNTSGVYFLYLDQSDKLPRYIGQSTNVHKRALKSAKKHKLNWYKYIPVQEEYLLDVEASWINTFSKCTKTTS